MFIKRKTYDDLVAQRDNADDNADRIFKAHKELEADLAKYKDLYRALYNRIAEDIDADVIPIELDPEHVTASLIDDKYCTDATKAPEVVDESSVNVSTTAIFGAGIRESLESRKKSVGTLTQDIVVVVDNWGETVAYGQYDLNDDYEWILDNTDVGPLNNVYVISVDLPKFSANTIKL
jgi:hypothetical protein